MTALGVGDHVVTLEQLFDLPAEAIVRSRIGHAAVLTDSRRSGPPARGAYMTNLPGERALWIYDLPLLILWLPTCHADDGDGTRCDLAPGHSDLHCGERRDRNGHLQPVWWSSR